ncbi:MAG: flavodoxin-dependent (E)-4-hydroxy-3-methylbut-2-enyl-diphosphate synthase [Clostridiales bacterium]|nr:flavodoxin-dependent (E)-4-hydroxy-3-methylbut-2-enyl-diphosphate synthase [Clostridiales bacterium]
MNYNEYRRKSRQVQVGGLYIGGDAPLSVQSMTNTDTGDVPATLAQVRALAASGCDLVRISIPSVEQAETIYKLKNAGVTLPLVADIHFDYKIALACVSAGVDKIRINPGNIGAKDRVRTVAKACAAKNIPIRIGVNGGSLEASILAKYGKPCAEALAESALYHAALLEEADFGDIILSIKSSDVKTMIEANRLLAEQCDYPLHLGVTEAGGVHMGTLKNAAGIGALLAEGIGDTLRISLTADPCREGIEGTNLLKAMGLYNKPYVNLTSCPTCARTKVNLISYVETLEKRIEAECHPSRPVHAAFMGCAVNGPGEAREADVGIAAGAGEGLLFKNGQAIGKIPEEKMMDVLIEEINKY